MGLVGDSRMTSFVSGRMAAADGSQVAHIDISYAQAPGREEFIQLHTDAEVHIIAGDDMRARRKRLEYGEHGG